MRAWSFIFSFIVMSVVCLAHEWPLPESNLDEILRRSSRWGTLSTEKQAETRSKLIYALHLAGSLEAKKIFFAQVTGEWDSNAPLARKQELIKEAESLALEGAKKMVDKWANAKMANGRLMTAQQIIIRLTGMNLATEEFHEWDRFLTEQGELNLKSWPLGGDPSQPEKNRAPSDLVAFLSKSYPGSPAARRNEARKRDEHIRKREAALDAPQSRRISFPIQENHGFAPSLRSCGTPGANAASLRPEFNGRQ